MNKLLRLFYKIQNEKIFNDIGLFYKILDSFFKILCNPIQNFFAKSDKEKISKNTIFMIASELLAIEIGLLQFFIRNEVLIYLKNEWILSFNDE